MFGSSVRLFRVAGIDIRVDASWLVIFALVTWSLAVGYFPAVVPGLTAASAWILGIVAALLFFGSVLLHELSHSLVAKSRGLGVHSITLFIFGGVSSLTSEPARPATEFLVALVGPLTSLAIGGLALLAAAVLPLPTGVGAMLDYLGLINGLLGLFNLIPGFPLDGGRVLRSLVWQATGNLVRSTRIAAWGGRIVAFLFLLWGLFRVFNGDLIGGIWIAAIGWFLETAASGSVHQLAVDRAMQGIRVRDVFRPGAMAVRPDESVGDAIRWTLLPYNLQTVPVADSRVLGILSADAVGRVPQELRDRTPVSQVMTRPEHLVTVGPNDALSDAFGRLSEANAEEALVIEDGRLVGLLTRADVMRALRIREELDTAA